MAKFIRGLYNILSEHQGGIVTIGNFDGLHIGHQALIANVKARAFALQVPSVAVIFEPQPAEFFAGEKSAPRLMCLREKFYALISAGIDYVLVLQFNRAFANILAKDFIKLLLINNLCAKHIVIGDDFRFGYRREGDFKLLEQTGQQYGFTVEAMSSVQANNERVSSTRIRQALVLDDLLLAKQLLGRPYRIQGRVVHGDKLGHQLGFPTANIHLHRNVAAVSGIYTVRVYGISQNPLPGVASVGMRPTVGGTRNLLEVHLLNFDRDVYGSYITVEFCKKLRKEEYYPHLNLLKDAIAKDVTQAKYYFEERGEL